jgi:hypothetical protein
LNHTLTEVAQTVESVFPRARVQHVVNGDRRNYRVSFEKIRAQLGFQCIRTLAEGIRELKSALEGEQVRDYTDLRYHNQKFLLHAGSPASDDELDSEIMAAFSRRLPHRAVAVAGARPTAVLR